MEEDICRCWYLLAGIFYIAVSLCSLSYSSMVSLTDGGRSAKFWMATVSSGLLLICLLAIVLSFVYVPGGKLNGVLFSSIGNTRSGNRMYLLVTYFIECRWQQFAGYTLIVSNRSFTSDNISDIMTLLLPQFYGVHGCHRIPSSMYRCCSNCVRRLHVYSFILCQGRIE